MLVLMLCLVMQLDPDVERLHADDITDEEISFLAEKTMKMFDENSTVYSMTKREKSKLFKLISDTAKEYWGKTIPGDEVEPIAKLVEEYHDNRKKGIAANRDSLFRVEFDVSHDKFKGSYFHSAAVVNKRESGKVFGINFLVPKEKDYIPSGMSFTVTDDDLDDFRKLQNIDVMVNGENVFNTLDGDRDSDTTAKVGVWRESLATDINIDQLRGIFGEPDAQVAFRFGAHEFELDKPTVRKIHAWLTANHPAFKEQDQK